MFDWLADVGGAIGGAIETGAEVIGDAAGSLFDLGEDIFSAGADALGGMSQSGSTEWLTGDYFDKYQGLSDAVGAPEMGSAFEALQSMPQSAIESGGGSGILSDMMGWATSDQGTAILGGVAKQYLASNAAEENRKWMDQQEEKRRTWQGAYYVPTNTGPTNAQ